MQNDDGAIVETGGVVAPIDSRFSQLEDELRSIRGLLEDLPVRREILTVQEAADFLRVSPRTLREWHSRGDGPKRCRIAGGMIRYRRADLEEFVERQAEAWD